MTPDPQPQQSQKEEKVLIKKYKIYISNIEWHIKTNKPEGSALDYCQIQLKCFEEIRSDLQKLSATQPIQGRDEKQYPPNIEKSIDKDPICSTVLFGQIKGNVAGIMFDFLGMNEAGTHIEANPATHVIAKYIYHLLEGRDEKEYPIEFIEWYSGESEDTIKSAYSRYQKEIEQGQP